MLEINGSDNSRRKGDVPGETDSIHEAPVYSRNEAELQPMATSISVENSLARLPSFEDDGQMSGPVESIRSYESRDVDWEEETKLGQKNSGSDTRTKITHIERSGFGVIGSVLAVNYGTWHKQPAALIVTQYIFRSKRVISNLAASEVFVSFYNSKRRSDDIPDSRFPVVRDLFPRGVDNEHMLLNGKSWSQKKRAEDHQVLWKIKKASNELELSEYRLAVIVECSGRFEGTVEVDAKQPLSIFSSPWSADDPLLFDGATAKGPAPPRLDFEMFSAMDWKTVVSNSDSYFNPEIYSSAADNSNRSDQSDSKPPESSGSARKDSSDKAEPKPSARFYRIRGIPYYPLYGGLSIAPISSGDDWGLIHVHSLADNPYRHEKVAIASIEGNPAFLAQSKQADEFQVQCKYRLLENPEVDLNSPLSLVFDTNFKGFTVLGNFKESLGHTVDCIWARWTCLGSFKDRGAQYMWLQDSLPLDLGGSNSKLMPRVRILIYGYDAHLSNSRSFQSISDIAGQFQASLRAIRTGNNSKRPLIFIGHSLGGLIIKQALINMNDGDELDQANLKSTCGALFFGVPNRGMDIESLIPIVGDQPNRALLESLGRNSEFLRSQAHHFPRAFSFTDSQVYSFFETLKSPTARWDGSEWEMDGKLTVLVDTTSATHSRPWELSYPFVLGMNRNHSDLVKFSRYDEDYERVRGYLRALVTQAEEVVQKRFPANP